jgi:hypothetical protein
MEEWFGSVNTRCWRRRAANSLCQEAWPAQLVPGAHDGDNVCCCHCLGISLDDVHEPVLQLILGEVSSRTRNHSNTCRPTWWMGSYPCSYIRLAHTIRISIASWARGRLVHPALRVCHQRYSRWSRGACAARRYLGANNARFSAR